VQGGSTANITLVLDTTTLATLPAVTVATGDVIVVHINPDTASGFDAPASETTSKNQYPSATFPSNHDNAWDFHGGTTGIAFSHRVLRVRDAAGNTQDGIAFVNPSVTTPPAAFPGQLQALQTEGHWLPASCGGAPCSYSSTPTAVEVSASWQGVSTNRTITVQRVSATDSNMNTDWAVLPSTLGAPNP
jgi:hypothetical protein